MADCAYPKIPFSGFHQCNIVTLRSKLGTISIRQGQVNSLVPDLITIVPEPRQIEGNQQILAKWD